MKITYRQEKLCREIVRLSSQIILHGLKDPRIGFVTVTRSKISPDLKYATIYLTLMGEPKQQKLAWNGLQHARPFIQKELGTRLGTRVIPEIRFEVDDSLEKVEHVMGLFKQIEQERQAREVSKAPSSNES